jgi:beta-N-acetylhexosaminidase
MRQVIRKGIGFDGLVMCDDLDMAALRGSLAERAKSVIAAGCDVALHCSGKFEDMVQVAAAVPELSGKALARFEAALGRLKAPGPFDEEQALVMLEKVQAISA